MTPEQKVLLDKILQQAQSLLAIAMQNLTVD